MKKISLIFACLIIVLLSTTGCGTRTPMMVTLDGEIRLSESTDNITVKELEKRLQEVSLHNSEKPLFNKVFTETRGFLNSIDFGHQLPTTNFRERHWLKHVGTPFRSPKGIIEEKRLVFL